MHRKLVCAALFLGLVVCVFATASIGKPDRDAASRSTWYVSPTGDDLDGTGAIDGPFQTIQRAVDAASAGDEVVIADGVYAGAVEMGALALEFRSQSGNPQACVIDGDGTDAGFSFFTADLDQVAGPVFRDLTVRNCTTAFAIDKPFDVGRPRTESIVAGCRVVDCGSGVAGTLLHVQVGDSRFRGIDGYCISVESGSALVLDSDFRDSGGGLSVIDYDFTAEVGAFRSSFVGNDLGCRIYVEWYNFGFEDCRVDSNATGMTMSSSEAGGVRLSNTSVSWNTELGVDVAGYHTHFHADTGTVISDNDGDGVITSMWFWTMTFADTEISRNGGHGVIVGNGGWGGGAGVSFTDCTIADNLGWGVDTDGNSYLLDIQGCRITGNGVGGVRDNCRTMLVDGCLISDNGGPGMVCTEIASGDPGLTVTATTIVNNSGDGVATDHDAVAVDRALVVWNGGEALNVGDAVSSVMCSSLHGNAGGDWIGVLGGFLGIDGNISADPRFCEPTTGDYHLAANSPCAPDANPACGQIGALGVGCGSMYFVAGAVRDLRGWPMPNVTMSGLPGSPPTNSDGTYSALIAGNTTATVAPTLPLVSFVPASRSYSGITADFPDQDFVGSVPGVVAIDDVQVYVPATGEPVSPYASLLVTVEGVVSAPPGTFTWGGGYIQGPGAGVNFYSDDPAELQLGDRVAITGYPWWDSNGEIYLGLPVVDILEPGPSPVPMDVPVADLVGDFEWVGSLVRVNGRVVDEGVLDSPPWVYVRVGDSEASVVVYAHPGTDVDFSGIAVGDVLNIAGICTKAGAEVRLGPRFPADYEVTTGVPGDEAPPARFELHPCSPNPFNPRTTIVYEVERSGPTILRIFDMVGRLVVTLVDEEVAVGRHEVVWAGLDSGGRALPSGVYLSRLESSGQVAHGRMTLVR
ncbi:MAG: right-handed parallel beta-helix repeat-containing protein [Candidatus Krumholzibacteriia bacterium]